MRAEGRFIEFYAPRKARLCTKVIDAEAWADAQARMTLEDDRIPWDLLKNEELWEKD